MIQINDAERQHIRYTPLAEVIVPGMPLGRHIVHDERSHDYGAELATKIVSVAHLSVGLPLDQVGVGSCTAEAECGALNSKPNHVDGSPAKTQDDAYQLYHDETVLEGEPWPPNDPGGSGLFVCRAAKARGWIRLYRHAFGVDQALRATVRRPALFGVNWYEGFDSPDKDGVVKISGQIRGGHEIVALRIIAEHQLVGFANSWGTGYGVPDDEIGMPDGGAFYMSFATVDELLKQQGDCTIPYV